MKKIHILYESKLHIESEKTVQRLSDILEGEGYIVTETVDLTTEADIGRYVDRLLADNPPPDDPSDTMSSFTPQLIISLHMAGFSARMSDGSPYINLLPVNIVVCIDRDKDDYTSIQSGRFNVTTSFCDTWEHGLPEYLDTLRWRF